MKAVDKYDKIGVDLSTIRKHTAISAKIEQAYTDHHATYFQNGLKRPCIQYPKRTHMLSIIGPYRWVEATTATFTLRAYERK